MLLAVIAYALFYKPRQPVLSFCPDEKIINQMPAGDGTINKEYYIYKGQRYEIEQFDQKWLQEYCSIKEQVVY